MSGGESESIRLIAPVLNLINNFTQDPFAKWRDGRDASLAPDVS